MEAELDAEQRRGRDSAAETRKLAKQLQDLRVQAEEDHRSSIELSESVNTLQVRIVTLKRQVDESVSDLPITRGLLLPEDMLHGPLVARASIISTVCLQAYKIFTLTGFNSS